MKPTHSQKHRSRNKENPQVPESLKHQKPASPSFPGAWLSHHFFNYITRSVSTLWKITLKQISAHYREKHATLPFQEARERDLLLHSGLSCPKPTLQVFLLMTEMPSVWLSYKAGAVVEDPDDGTGHTPLHNPHQAWVNTGLFVNSPDHVFKNPSWERKQGRTIWADWGAGKHEEETAAGKKWCFARANCCCLSLSAQGTQ